MEQKPTAFLYLSKPILTQDEEQNCFNRWYEVRETDSRLADRRLTELILHYTPIIRKLVRKLSGYAGIDPEELINEGLLGLVEAATRFDPDRGLRFATYAASWIRGMLLTYITRNYFITNVAGNSTNKRLFYGLRRVLGRFDLTTDMVEKLADRFNTSEDQIRTMYVMLRSPYDSLNVQIGDSSDGATREEMIESGDPTPEENVMTEKRIEFHRHILDHGMEVLDRRERRIFMAQLLQDPDDVKTLEELGVELSLSRERIRQIRDIAQTKVTRSVRDYLNHHHMRPADLF